MKKKFGVIDGAKPDSEEYEKVDIANPFMDWLNENLGPKCFRTKIPIS